MLCDQDYKALRLERSCAPCITKSKGSALFSSLSQNTLSLETHSRPRALLPSPFFSSHTQTHSLSPSALPSRSDLLPLSIRRRKRIWRSVGDRFIYVQGLASASATHSMDKSWMLADRRSLRFQIGFENFLQFALANAADKSSIRYPCLKCCNHHEFTIGVIKGHVYFNGIMTNYRTWSLHGETSSREGNNDEESESVDMPEVEDGDESEVRHILDVMHIEKNCCDAIIGTLLNIPGKTKDGVNARLDMVDMGIKTDVKVVAGEKKTKLPLGSWNLLHKEKKIVCGSFFGMSVPTGFSSNIRNLVSMADLKLAGLKSHDCHTVMQYLLPVVLRSVLEKPVSKVIDVSRLKQMQVDLVDTGCIAEKYIVEEAIEFLEDCVLSQSGTTVGIPSTSIAGHYKQSRPLSRPTMVSVYGKQMHLAHLCVLQNTQDVQPYFKEHKEYLKLIYPNLVKNKKWMREKENETFPDWLKERVVNQLRLKPNNVSQIVRWLAAGPKM
ncbi:hypothetical protein ACLB2K_035700 [Fragaria x ananassa]